MKPVRLIDWRLTLLVSAVFMFSCLQPNASESKPPDIASLINHVKAVFNQGRYQSVVNYLAPYEYQYGGRQDFDYYLGTAYLETGNFGQAVFLLERAVAINPNFAGARFELARAQFLSNNFEAAKTHFELVLDSNPPPKVEYASQNYLRLIEYKVADYAAVHKPLIGLRVGYDSNAVNGHEEQIFENFFERTGFFIDENNRETSSPYASLLLADSYSRPFSDNAHWSIAGSALTKQNTDAEFVNLQVFNLSGGLGWQQDNSSFDINGGYLTAQIEGVAGELTEELTKDATFLGLVYGLETKDKGSVSLELRRTAFRHDEILEIKDINRVELKVNYKKSLFDDWLFNIKLSLGEDSPTENSDLYQSDRGGLEVGLSHPFSNTLLLNTRIKYEQIDYQAYIPFATIVDDSFDLVFREDKRYLMDLTLVWFQGLNWRYSGKLIYVDHQSNSVFYDFDKTAIEFAASYYF